MGKKRVAAWVMLLLIMFSVLGAFAVQADKRICDTISGVEYSYTIRDGGIKDLRIEKADLSLVPLEMYGGKSCYTIHVPGVFEQEGEFFAVSSIGECFLKNKTVTGSAVTASGSVISGMENGPVVVDFSDTSLKEIPAYAFAGEKEKGGYTGVERLAGVTGLDQVESVGSLAFYNCSGISFVSLPSCRTIGASAFQRSGIRSFSSDTLQRVEKNAFSECSGLESFEADTLQEAGEAAFSESTNLSRVTAGSLASIGEKTFLNCSGLSSLSMNNLKSVASGAFYGCTGLKDFSGDNVTAVGDDAFNSCTGLETVSLPVCKTTGQYAFFRCASLKSFRADVLEEVGDGAFQECPLLESFEAEKLVRVGNYAFYQTDENNLVGSRIFQLGSLTDIGNGAFKNCRKVTYLSTEFLQTAGTSSFAGSGLRKCYLYADSLPADAFEGADHLTLFSMNPNTDFLTRPDGSALSKKQAADALYGVRVVGYSRCTAEEITGISFMDFSAYKKKTGDGSYIPANASSRKVVFALPEDLYGVGYEAEPEEKEILHRSGYAYVPLEYAELADPPSMKSLPVVDGEKKSRYRFVGYAYDGRVLVDQNGVFAKKGFEVLPEDKDAVLEAVFERDSYRVVYEDAFFKEGFSPAQTYLYGEEFLLPDQESMYRKGYVFEGWMVTAGLENGKRVEKIPAGADKDVTVRAQWSPREYVVDYDANGGTGYSIRQKRTFGEKYSLLSCPFGKTGYQFDGWTDAQGCSVEKFDPDTAVDITLYASWVPVTYAIGYKEVDGVTWNGEKKESYTIETENFLLPVPEKKGYVFEGWMDKEGKERTEIAKGSTGNMELTARWSPAEYSITYHWNGGKEAAAAKSYVYGKGVSLPAAVREHYAFGGWFTSPTQEGVAVSSVGKQDAGDLEFYAKWVPVTYTVTLDAGDGNKKDLSYTVESDMDISAVPEKTGYDFKGWYLDGKKYDHISSGTSGDFTLTASWEKQTFPVTYDVNGGTITDRNYSTTHVYGESEVLPTGVERSGYTFEGWYTKADFSGEVVKNVTEQTGVFFYAKWRPCGYTYRYHYKDEDGKDGMYVYAVEYGSLIPYPDVVQKDYRLDQWQETTGGTEGRMLDNGSRVYVEGDRDFTAVMRSTHTYLVFHAGDGKCSVSQKEVYPGQKAGDLPEAERDGYEFIGWMSASGVRYSSENVIDLKEGSALILYAVYRRQGVDEISDGVKKNDSIQVADDGFEALDQAVPEAEKTDEVWYTAPATGIYYSLLGSEEKKLYAGLYNYYRNGEHMGSPYACSLRTGIDVPQIQNALQSFMFDHKELSWISGAEFSLRHENGGTQIQFGIISGYDYELVQKAYESITESDAFRELLKSVKIKEGDTDAQKVKKIADTVADYVTYTSDVGEDGKYSSRYRDAAYVVFLQKNHEAVCVGYSILFQQICRYYGVECVIVSGTTTDGGHAWNYVKIDGLWYGVDTTWYDSDRGGDYILAGTGSFNQFERSYRSQVIGKDLSEVMDFAEEDYKEGNVAVATAVPVPQTAETFSPEQTAKTSSPASDGGITGVVRVPDMTGDNAPLASASALEKALGGRFVYSVKGSLVTISSMTTKGYAAKKIIVPDTKNLGYRVRIAKNAFKNASVKSAVLGDGVVRIDRNAFGGCKKLKNVRIKSQALSKAGKKIFSRKVTIRVPKKKKKAYKKLFAGQKCRIVA